MKIKTVQHTSNILLFTAIIFACVIGVNLLGIKYEKKFDLTASNVFSLAPQTVKVLRSLDEQVSVYAYIRPEQGRDVTDLLNLCRYESDNFRYQIIDPDKQPALAKRHNVTKYGTFVVESASGKSEVIQKLGESEIVNAILRVISGEVKKIYVLTGHGERLLGDKNPRGWSKANGMMEQAGYKIKTLNWFETGKIPEDADLLIVAGPRNDYTKNEVELLRKRLNSGGSTLFTLDPTHIPNLTAFMKEWGITLKDDMVLDTVSEQLGFGSLVAAVATYTKHPIVKDIKAASFYPVSRSLELDANNEKIDLKAVGLTGTESWGETDLVSIEKGSATFDATADYPGSRIIIATAEWEVGEAQEKLKIGEARKKARMVVVGDSDFASNSTLGLSSNKDVFLNIIGWLVGEEARLSIRSNKTGFHPIIFTSDQLKWMFWPVVVVLPSAVALVGFVVMARRRRI